MSDLRMEQALARAAHTRALGTPQLFPLIGDGEETRKVIAGGRQAVDMAPALAEARYLDWQAEQMLAVAA